MAEALAESAWRDAIPLKPVGNQKGCDHFDCDASSESDREEMDDLMGPLTELGGDKGLSRTRTRTTCSTCSCSGTPLWQPPDDPTAINMLDVP